MIVSSEYKTPRISIYRWRKKATQVILSLMKKYRVHSKSKIRWMHHALNTPSKTSQPFCKISSFKGTIKRNFEDTQLQNIKSQFNALIKLSGHSNDRSTRNKTEYFKKCQIYDNKLRDQVHLFC